MKTLLIVHIFVFAVFSVSAQEVVSSAGETQKISGIEISWTIGEPVIETISSGSTVLTQGFHQSGLTVTAIDELPFSDFELKVYPNPTSGFVNVQFNKLVENTNYLVFDSNGKMIDNGMINSTNTSLDFKKFASGSYILKLNYNSNHPLQTFKIVKK